jgi:uncharacterized protein (TIRG00374 family)
MSIRAMSEARSLEIRGAAAARSPSSWRLRLLTGVAKAIVSVTLVWYLFTRYAPEPERFARLDLGACALALTPLFATLLPATERWRLILGYLGNESSRVRIFQVFYASVFFTQVLLSVGGDVVRVLYHRALGGGVNALLASVLLDRGVALCALCLLALLSLPRLPNSDEAGAIALTVCAVAAGFLAAAYLGAVLLRAARATRQLRAMPVSLQALFEGVTWTLTSKTGLFNLLPLSIAVHLLSILAMFMIGRALGIPLSFWDMLAVGPIILLAQVLPISIGGWGVRETAAVFLLPLIGVDATSALSSW